mmetsp:Transcript_40261/g.101113  ORF Transcript_40261/g.101113 Transcript_40261/m.101113 type:complete len:443 (+) Transcript_40261:72-1400(+)
MASPIVAALSLLATLLLSEGEILPASSARVRWQGRALWAENGSASFSWAGVQASMTVRNATTVSVRLMSDFKDPTISMFRVFVDNGPGVKIHVRGAEWEEYMLVSGLSSSSAHNITLWYATDPVSTDWEWSVTNQRITIESFITDGGFESPPPVRQRRLEFIGDSSMAGDHIDTAAGVDHCRGDHSGSYSALICGYFQANCSTMALTGHSVYRNCCGDPSDQTMVNLSRRIIAGDGSAVFDDSQFVPDATVLHLGTNDARWIKDEVEEKDFVSTYVNFLRELTVRHATSNLPIFCLIGPKPVPETDQLVRDAVDQYVSRFGSRNVHFVNLTGAELDGCHDHPGWKGHRQAFDMLIGTMSEVLGWNGTSSGVHQMLPIPEQEPEPLNIAQRSNSRVWLIAVSVCAALLLLAVVSGTVVVCARRQARCPKVAEVQEEPWPAVAP